MFEAKISFHQLWQTSNGKWNVHPSPFYQYVIKHIFFSMHKKYQNLRGRNTVYEKKSENQVNWQILSVAFEPLLSLVVTEQAPQIWNEQQEVGALLLVLPSPRQGGL